MLLVCKCGFEWNYHGNAEYRAQCPKCHRRIRLIHAKGYKLPSTSKSELKYIAGFFDGEGSVYISKSKSHDKDILRLNISIGNTNKEVLDYICETFQTGKVKLDRITKGNKNFYVWWRGGYTAAEILKAIEPYMLVRKEQAILGIQFQSIISNNWEYNRWKRIPKNIIQQREDMHLQMKKLNK